MRTAGLGRGPRRAVAICAVLAAVLTACSVDNTAAPRCGAVQRVALTAQTVPGASYVPCVPVLPAGWRSRRFDATDGHSSFELISDRAAVPVRVEFGASCSYASATPFEPRTPGGRSYLLLRSITPHYAGTMFDVFPGGCVSYRFDFPRGPHITLMADLQSAVGFVTRRQLRLDMRRRLGVEVSP